MKALIYASVKVEKRYNVKVSDTTMMTRDQKVCPTKKQKIKIKF